MTANQTDAARKTEDRVSSSLPKRAESTGYGTGNREKHAGEHDNQNERRGKTSCQERPATFRELLIDRKGDQGGCFPFGVGTLCHSFTDGNIKAFLPVFIRYGVDLFQNRIILLITDKGVGGLLCINAGVKLIGGK